MKAWAICNTDGGRHEPKPLVRHIYATEQAAETNREYYFRGQEHHYPIKAIGIRFEDVT